MTAQPAYPLDSWLEDLHLCIKVEGQTIAEAAVRLGLSRATAYRLVARARAAGQW